jgi:hypothetical protein
MKKFVIGVLLIVTTNVFGYDSTTKVGNTYFHSDGTSSTTVGNTTFHSNGTSSTTIGNSTFNSNGTSSTRVGNSTFNSNGSSYNDNQFNKVGNTIYGGKTYGW